MSQAARRRLQEEAAERRRQETEQRGIKDPEKVRRQQQRAAEMEREELEAAKRGNGNPALKVNRPRILHSRRHSWYVSVLCSISVASQLGAIPPAWNSKGTCDTPSEQRSWKMANCLVSIDGQFIRI